MMSDSNNNLCKINDKKIYKKEITNRQKPIKSYSKEIIEWDEYIHGKRKTFPGQKGSKTLISESKSEHAANKPIVKGFIEGKCEKIFLDTVAESSVVDFTLFTSMRKDYWLKQFHLKKLLTFKITC